MSDATNSPRRLIPIALLLAAGGWLACRAPSPGETLSGPAAAGASEEAVGATASRHVARHAVASGAVATEAAVTRRAEAERATYLMDRVMLAPVVGVDLEEIASAWHVDVLRAVGPSGFGAVAVPAGWSSSVFMQRVLDDERVARVAPMGRVAGASLDLAAAALAAQAAEHAAYAALRQAEEALATFWRDHAAATRAVDGAQSDSADEQARLAAALDGLTASRDGRIADVDNAEEVLSAATSARKNAMKAFSESEGEPSYLLVGARDVEASLVEQVAALEAERGTLLGDRDELLGALATADQAVVDAKDADADVDVLEALDLDIDLLEQQLADLEALTKTVDDELEDSTKALEEASKTVAELVEAVEGAELDRTWTLRKIQWHLETSGHPRWSRGRDAAEAADDRDYSSFIVAILDTGVAYETRAGFVAAPSLAHSAIVSPHDFVNDDANANDDHQHGTHLASLIASDGDVVGYAPGCALMPVKVLDANNQGTELDLIDGIHWAIDHGAHVINLSLSFGLDYLPSAPLAEALRRAAEAGVVVVGAAGNSNASAVTWPAASPDVIAVGATSVTDSSRKLFPSSYSNHSPLVDVMAPGGAAGNDLDADGVGDGLLGETIALGDPSQVGLWLYAGTSQATALVSGVVVQLLEAGARPQDVAVALESGGDEGAFDKKFWGHELGARALDADKALELVEDGGDRFEQPSQVYASIMPYLSDQNDGEEVEPRASIAVVDEDGEPYESAEVLVTVHGASEAAVRCKTNGEGVCDVKLDTVSMLVDGEIGDPGLVWSWSIDATIRDGRILHPGPLLFATDGFALIQQSVDATPDAADGLLAVYWAATDDPELGELSEAYAVSNAGTGISTSPSACCSRPAR